MLEDVYYLYGYGFTDKQLPLRNVTAPCHRPDELMTPEV